MSKRSEPKVTVSDLWLIAYKDFYGNIYIRGDLGKFRGNWYLGYYAAKCAAVQYTKIHKVAHRCVSMEDVCNDSHTAWEDYKHTEIKVTV